MQLLVVALAGGLLVLVLVGLHQYGMGKWQWFPACCGWASLALVVVGVGLQFRSVVLPAWLVGGTLVAWLVGWQWLSRKYSGGVRHAVRGLAFAVCLGPLIAIPYRELPQAVAWLRMVAGLPPGDFVQVLLSSLPGLVLPGALAYLTSVVATWVEGPRRVMQPYRWLVIAAVGVTAALTLNWYAAGVVPIGAVIPGHPGWLRYVLLSRPGVARERTAGGELGKGRSLWPHAAVDAHDAQALVILLRAGVDPNVSDYNTISLLLSAAEKGDLALVRLLLRAGAKTAADEGGGPLHSAVFSGNAAIVDAMLKAGADVNARTSFRRAKGSSVVAELPRAASLDIVRLLLAAGLNVRGRDRRGATVLHEAVGDEPEAIRLLIAAGADVNAQDSQGKTPLHCAAYYGELDTMTVLLDAGADTTLEDAQGQTALDAAHDKAARALLLKRAPSPGRQ